MIDGYLYKLFTNDRETLATRDSHSLMRNDRRLTVSFAGNVVQQTWFQNGANRVVKFFGTRRGVALGLGVGAFGVDKGWGKKDLAR